MKPLLPTLFLSLGLSTVPVAPAAAYPVDCAILLCLAGGWPASAECAHARAVFIQRITPWPIEPPLQIWNCPMRASFRNNILPSDRIFEIAWPRTLSREAMSTLFSPPAIILADDRADIDLSDPAFDFVRSIHVFQIDYQQRPNARGVCKRTPSVQVGTYGEQGDFHWSLSAIESVPEASGLQIPLGCRYYRFRSVFLDWRDSEGSHGFEEVRY